MSDQNIALVRRWFEEVWNQRREQTIDELLTGDSICYADEGPLRGPKEFKERQYQPFQAAFSHLHLAVEEMVAHGDHVVVRWRATGVHSGNSLGFSATHQPVTFRGITWIRVREGKMMEGWQHSNIPEVVRTLSAQAPA